MRILRSVVIGVVTFGMFVAVGFALLLTSALITSGDTPAWFRVFLVVAAVVWITLSVVEDNVKGRK